LGEVSKAAIEGFVGPVLKCLLVTVDENRKNVDRLIREPLCTGVREALSGLQLDAKTEADQQALLDRLRHADAKLADALSLVRERKDAEKTKFLICLMRALIMNRRSAIALANQELEFCKSYVGRQLQSLDERRIEANAALETNKEWAKIMLARAGWDNPQDRNLQLKKEELRKGAGVLKVATRTFQEMNALKQFLEIVGIQPGLTAYPQALNDLFSAMQHASA
jgi:hypothetical protein